MTKQEQEKELLLQADPALRKQYEAELLRQADPQLNGDNGTAPRVPAWWRGKPEDWVNATPESRQSAINIHDGQRNKPSDPSQVHLDYNNLPATPPPRQARSIFNLGDWSDLFRGMYKNGGESLTKFGHSVYDTMIDPYNAANAFTNGLPTVDMMESAVNATPGVLKEAPAMIGGLALNQFSDEVQQAIIAQHPELAPPIEKGRTVSENIHNAGQAVANYLGEYGDRPGEVFGTGLYEHLQKQPFQSLSDLSIPATLGAGAVAKMGLNAAWRASLAESLIAKGLPGGIAQAAVNAPRVAVNAMNPINWVTYPAGQIVSRGTRAVANALTPPRRAMMALVNNDIKKAKQVESKLKHTIANPIIEGSNPTAAEAIEPNPHGPAVAVAEGAEPNLLLAGGDPTLQLPDGGNTLQLPGGPNPTGLLDERIPVDSHLLDGHSYEAITGPAPVAPPEPPVTPHGMPNEPAEAPHARPTNVLNRDTPPGAAPGAAPEAPPMMNNALNQARPVEQPRWNGQVSDMPPNGSPKEDWNAWYTAREAEAARTAPPRQAPPPEAPPQPQQEAPKAAPEPTPQPEPEVAPTPEPEAPKTEAPASDYDFMGKINEVQKLINGQPEAERLLKMTIARAEREIPKAEEGLLMSSKYGKKFIEIAKMNNITQQEAAFKSWIEEEPNAAEVLRHYTSLKKYAVNLRGAEDRLAQIPKDLEGWQSTLDKLMRGEEGHFDINTIAAAIDKQIADYHAANAAAGVVTLPPHPGVGVRGVPRPGTPGVVASKFSAAGKAAELNEPDAFREVYNRNNAARMKVNNELGKTGPAGNVDRPTAEAQHEALAKIEFDKGRNKLSTSDATLQRFLNRPLSGKVMDHARDLLGERGKQFGTGPYVPAHIDAAGNYVPAVYPQYSGEELHALVQALTDIAFDPNVVLKGGMSKAALDAVKGTRADVLRWIGLRSNNPELITAMKNYAVRSNQIDRMKLAEHLESILQKPVSEEYTPRQRADAYANAIKPSNQAATLEAATGRKLHQSFDHLVTPKESGNIQAIKDDLAREALSKEHAKLGRDHSGIINTAATDGIGATHVPGHNGMLNNLREFVMGRTDERVKKHISEGMTSAEGGLKLMSNALRQQEAFDIVGEAARKTGRTVNNLATKVPTVYNVTEQQRDAKKKKGGTR